jgi:hypothetical protein
MKSKSFAITVLTASTLTAGTLGFAAAAATVGLAPIAAAAENTTVQQDPGNVQIVATPGQAAQNAATLQQPFGGNPNSLIYHH